MDTELNGLNLDVVYIDEAADVSDKTMVSIWGTDNWGAESWGTTTGRIWGQKDRPCALCHVDYYIHGYETPHPFFNNNLEYLEYEYEKTL